MGLELRRAPKTRKFRNSTCKSGWGFQRRGHDERKLDKDPEPCLWSEEKRDRKDFSKVEIF
jgi:hypothetical protein